MFAKQLITFCLVLGCTFMSLNAVEDIEFLKTISTKYSPTLVKQLLVNRLDHKLNQIAEMNTTVGINQAQQDLCSVIFQAIDTLRSDVVAMDEQQVICGDNTYTKTVTSFIGQFSLLTTMFAIEFEALKTPNLNIYAPDDLIAMLDSSAITNYDDKGLKTIGSSVAAYTTAIDKVVADAKTADEIKVLGHGIGLEMRNITATIDTWAKTTTGYTKSDLAQLLEKFKNAVDIFYRQLELYGSHITKLF